MAVALVLPNFYHWYRGAFEHAIRPWRVAHEGCSRIAVLFPVAQWAEFRRLRRLIGFCASHLNSSCVNSTEVPCEASDVGRREHAVRVLNVTRASRRSGLWRIARVGVSVRRHLARAGATVRVLTTDANGGASGRSVD